VILRLLLLRVMEPMTKSIPMLRLRVLVGRPQFLIKIPSLTLELSIERPHAIIEGKHEYIDNRRIPSGPGYMVDLEDVDIYPDIRESLTT